MISVSFARSAIHRAIHTQQFTQRDMNRYEHNEQEIHEVSNDK